MDEIKLYSICRIPSAASKSLSSLDSVVRFEGPISFLAKKLGQILWAEGSVLFSCSVG